MKPPFPSLTPTWHNESYTSIQPTRAELSAANRVVVITGAGAGIGRGIALAFAEAGARHIALIGRTLSALDETASLIQDKTETSVHTAAVTNEQALQSAAAAIGIWDILILNAGFLPTPQKIQESTSDDWWTAFETNVKGTMLTAKAFAPSASNERPVILGLSTGSVCLPPEWQPGSSAYATSKIAQIMLLDFIRAENPSMFVSTFHPGLIVTAMSHKAGNVDGPLPKDDISLPSHFAVWLASKEAGFLNGKFVWANWDVDELKAQKGDIEGNSILTANIVGWPHPHTG